MMLDGKKITKRSLDRAEERKRRAMLRKKQMQAAAAAAGICACSLILAMTRSFLAPLVRRPMEDGVIINDNQIPLAVSPFFSAKPAKPIFAMPDFSGAVSSGNGSELDMLLINPEENACYLTFEIILTATGESLYKSYMIAPAMCVERVALSGDIKKGAHEAALIIRAYDLENFAEIGSESAGFTLKK